jgi:hypothetical protein
MTTNFEETLISVWRRALVEAFRTVILEGVHYPVRPTSRSKLREVDFRFEEQTLRGLEQNPNTNSRWAQLAREGKQVMQFLSDGRYIANVIDGELQFYGASLIVLDQQLNRRVPPSEAVCLRSHCRVKKIVQLAPSWWKRFCLKRVKYSQGSLPRSCDERFVCG